ncbi:MAG: RNA polymerase sigma factor [Bacteroidales bacterium]|nr:RNA polymerase sigma factor [Bacteroidales bacterium]MBN2697823.1 RNA polymerase sigma factor [Bacteroidales bacterium]
MTVEEYNNAVEAYADNLYRFVLKNVKIIDAAQDLVQDTFEKLWIKIEGVDGRNVKSYLFTTAYHTMIDYLRKKSRMTDTEGFRKNESFHEEQYSDLKDILNRALENLPDEQRSVLMLRDYEGYSYREIGEITGLSESQVKVYIYRARVYLKAYIGNPETVI